MASVNIWSSFLLVALVSTAFGQSMWKPQCPPNEVYSSCNKYCQNLCGFHGPKGAEICGSICAPGCVCEGGLFRLNGVCVPYDQCNSGQKPRKHQTPYFEDYLLK